MVPNQQSSGYTRHRRAIDHRSQSGWRRLLARFRDCPDTEVEQNIVRVVLSALLLIYTIIYGSTAATYVVIAYLGYGTVVFVWIYLSPSKSIPRRVLHTLGDRGVISWVLLTEGAWASPAYILYIWVDIGNAARYGRSFLYLSTTCSAIGFGIVLLYNAYWWSLGPLAIGLWLGILMAPYYAGIFLRRLKVANERLNEIATRDALTRLPNRPFLYNRLNAAITASQRHDRQFAVLFVDLDGFKKINDSRGHEAGDDALQTAARVLRDAVRQTDTVARLGGDEFVVVVLDTQKRDIYRVGEHIREALRTATTDPLSASIGIAIFPFCGTDAETLVRHADHAMYAAKNAGNPGCHVCPDFLPDVAQHSTPVA